MNLADEFHPVPKPVKQDKPKRSGLKRSPMKKRRTKRARDREFPQWVKDTVRERSNDICEYCHAEPIVNIHHCNFRSQLHRDEGSGGLENALGLGVKCDALVHGGTEGEKYKRKFARLAKQLARR